MPKVSVNVREAHDFHTTPIGLAFDSRQEPNPVREHLPQAKLLPVRTHLLSITQLPGLLQIKVHQRHPPVVASGDRDGPGVR